MPSFPTIRVRAREGLCPHVNEMSRPTRRARAVGRDDAGNPCVEIVPDVAFYRRRIRDGGLELVTDAMLEAEAHAAPAPDVSIEAAPPAAPTVITTDANIAGGQVIKRVDPEKH